MSTSLQSTEGSPKNTCFYDPGVGSFGGDVLGKAFGTGLAVNIRQCYDFIVSRYEPDDRLFLFGFSRGAYTVRSLASFFPRRPPGREESKEARHWRSTASQKTNIHGAAKIRTACLRCLSIQQDTSISGCPARTQAASANALMPGFRPRRMGYGGRTWVTKYGP